VTGGLEVGAIGSRIADRRPLWQQMLAGFGSVWAGAGAGALTGGPIGALGGAAGALIGGIGSPLMELFGARRAAGQVDRDIAATRAAGGLSTLRDADGLTPRQRILRDQAGQRQADASRQPGTFEQFFRDMQSGLQRAQAAQLERWDKAQKPLEVQVGLKVDPTPYFAAQMSAQAAGEGLMKLIGASVG
jgi:hypothetical protein